MGHVSSQKVEIDVLNADTDFADVIERLSLEDQDFTMGLGVGWGSYSSALEKEARTPSTVRQFSEIAELKINTMELRKYVFFRVGV